MDPEDNSLLTLLHFNDAYNIEPETNGQNGVVNFEAYARKMRGKYPNNLLLHSGDAFSPSALTRLHTEACGGRQMTESLNKLKVDAACMGNHEFDLSDAETMDLFSRCNFPWLMGNILVKDTQQPIGGGQPYITKVVNGKKIGIFGVGGDDWIGIMLNEYKEQGGMVYEDSGQYSARISRKLREQDQCDLVIALTHLRVEEDQKVAAQADNVDIILGGHDHAVEEKFINQIPIIKSQDDFKYLSILQVYNKGTKPNPKYSGRRFDWDLELVRIPIATVEEVDLEFKQYVDKLWADFRANDVILGFTQVEMNVESNTIRTSETNMGNFMADLANLYNKTDCAVINSGSLRYGKIIQPGELWNSVFEANYDGELIIKEVTGQILTEVLERSVSAYPNEAGFFLQVSGIQYTYDHTKTPRVQSVKIQGHPIKNDKTYTLTTTAYVAEGGDGYDMLKGCRYLLEESKAISHKTLVHKFFTVFDTHIEDSELIKHIRKRKQQGKLNIQTLIKDFQENFDTYTKTAEFKKFRDEFAKKFFKPGEKVKFFEGASYLLEGAKIISDKFRLCKELRVGMKIDEKGNKYSVIAPKVENRIVNVSK